MWPCIDLGPEMEVAMDGIEERDLRVSIWVVDLQVVESVNLFFNLNVDRYYSSSSHLSTLFTSDLFSTVLKTRARR